MHSCPQTSDAHPWFRNAAASRPKAITSFLERRPVYADCPGAVLGAALIGAVATIGAAVIVGEAEVITAEINKSGTDTDSTNKDGTGKDGTDGTGKDGNGESRLVPTGTAPTEQTVGDDSLPIAVRGFLHRDIHASSSSTTRLSAHDSGRHDAMATTTYSFDGDIKKAPKYKNFRFQDEVTLRFDVSNIEDSHEAPLTFTVDHLILSTVDVADTDGHAAINFRAVQGPDVLWHWSARLAQGKVPEVTITAGSPQRIVRQEKDLLIIRNLQVPLSYKAPGADGTTRVEVIIAVEGAGAKT